MKRYSNVWFWAILLLVLGIPFALLLTFAAPRLAGVLPGLALRAMHHLPEDSRRRVYDRILRDVDLFGPELVAHSIRQLPEEEKEALYQRIATRVVSRNDVLPEPDVGRIAQANSRFVHRGAEVVTNNVGLRSHKPFRQKGEGVYRIVCLGDSMVFGAGGLEEDRFCDQLEAFYREAGVTVGGRPIETYAVGLGSWTMVNEATYLGSRMTDYDPDLVLVLTVWNDIDETLGVTGTGVVTRKFSPENRNRGTATFAINPEGYETRGVTALLSDLSPEGRAHWAKGMQRLRRLEELQRQRGKQILFSVLNTNPYFNEIYKDFYRRYGFRSPLIFTRYGWPGENTFLPHDIHPNRQGHSIFAHHYIHALAQAGIVPVADEKLPTLHRGLTADGALPPDRGRLEKLRCDYASRYLRTRLDFEHLEPDDLKAYLGGFFPERGEDPLGSRPFASVRSGFLLRRPNHDPARFELEIEVPPYPELYPFELAVSLHGVPVETFRLEDPEEAGRHLIAAEVPPLDASELALEVILETSSYWTTIRDPRMKSFYLLSARVD